MTACDRMSHPAKLEQGEDEDYVGYLTRQSEAWATNPPPAPPGFELIGCDASPRHWPLYSVVDDDFYGSPCPNCVYVALQDAHAPCQHSHHGRWRRWKVTHRVFGRLYALGVIAGSGWRYDGYCRGCLTTILWRGKRPYILGKSRAWWHCLLKGRHLQGDPIGFGLCAKCLPCPDCGSKTAGHEAGCPT